MTSQITATVEASSDDVDRVGFDAGASGRLFAVAPRAVRFVADLGPDSFVMGRVAEAPGSIALEHGTVSRRHLEVEWDAESRRHVVQDLESRNGSRVDGRALGRGWCPLEDGSVLRLGDVLLVYEAGHTLAEPPAVDVSRRAVPGDALRVRRLRAAIARAAPDVSPALVLGETGTGKEEVAQELHRLSGRAGPCVSVNCAALSQTLIESQLFGHVKGAFTGATSDQPGLFRAADGGTLFLDEIGEMPLALQPRLLRAVQEREVRPVGGTKSFAVDVRVVAATHRDLAERAQRGEFRQDLYARLTLWQLEIPALRERRADILTWIDVLYARWAETRNRPPRVLEWTVDAAERLLLVDWPENLRGLDRFVHEIASRRLRGPVRKQDIPDWVGDERV